MKVHKDSGWKAVSAFPITAALCENTLKPKGLFVTRGWHSVTCLRCLKLKPKNWSHK